MKFASPGVKEDMAPSIAPEKDPQLDRNHHLILWNDDVTPVNVVIHALMNLLGFTESKAIGAVIAIEKLGKGIVYSGALEVCELRHEQFGELKLTTTIESS